MNHTALIVDDEVHCSDRVVELIKKHPELNLSRSCSLFANQQTEHLVFRC